MGAKTYGYRSVPVYDPSERHGANGPVIVGRRREVDPEQATVIRQIYQWYLDGVSGADLADRLNTAGVPTPRGTRWTKNLIHRILTNERYLGRHIWGQTTYERRHGTNKLVPRRQPREQWHVADHPELRIIDDELWERVQAHRNALKKAFNIKESGGLALGRSGVYSKYLLVGLAQCGVCGNAGRASPSPAADAGAPVTGAPTPDTTDGRRAITD